MKEKHRKRTDEGADSALLMLQGEHPRWRNGAEKDTFLSEKRRDGARNRIATEARSIQLHRRNETLRHLELS